MMEDVVCALRLTHNGESDNIFVVVVVIVEVTLVMMYLPVSNASLFASFDNK